MADQEHLKILAQGVDVWNKWREENHAIRPDLSGVDLSRVNLSRVNLSRVNLIGADLSGADLSGVILGGADLTVANLISAALIGANFSRANLSNADLRDAILVDTVFANVDLSTVKNLDSCKHFGPSVIDHSTLVKSGRLTEIFLRGCGLSDEFIK